MKKADYEAQINAYRSTFMAVADKLGKDHPMVKLMGGLAWGRNDAERGPSEQTLRAAAVEYGFLRGCERMLVAWCNTQKDMHTARNLLIDTLMNARRNRQ